MILIKDPFRSSSEVSPETLGQSPPQSASDGLTLTLEVCWFPRVSFFDSGGRGMGAWIFRAFSIFSEKYQYNLTLQHNELQIYNFLMSGKLNKQQGEVVRLKHITEDLPPQKDVYVLSEEEKTVVLERAKILKLKVEVNENLTENFEELRREIKKLREQLAEARYLKNESKGLRRNDIEIDHELQNWERLSDLSGFDTQKHEGILKIFEDNQANYRSLVEIYEEHLKVCSHSAQVRKNINVHKEWKNLEKKNEAYRNLLKSVPAFSKIFRQNLLLRKQIRKEEKPFSFQASPAKVLSMVDQGQDKVNRAELTEVVATYEKLIKDVELKFAGLVEKLEQTYRELDAENKSKDEKIKELMERRELHGDCEELQKENEQLRLDIILLEEKVAELENNLTSSELQIKQLHKEIAAVVLHGSHHSGDDLHEDECEGFLSQLAFIKEAMEEEIKVYEDHQQETELYIKKLKQELIKYIEDNKHLSQDRERLLLQTKELKRKLNEILKIDNEAEITKDNNTFWTNEESSEDFMQMQFFFDRKYADEKMRLTTLLEKEEKLREKVEKELAEEEQKNHALSDEIARLHSTYSAEIVSLKVEITKGEHKRRQLLEENKSISEKVNKSEAGKEEPTLLHTPSCKKLTKYKEPNELSSLTEKSKKDKLEELRRKVSSSYLKKSSTLRIQEEMDESEKWVPRKP